MEQRGAEDCGDVCQLCGREEFARLLLDSLLSGVSKALRCFAKCCVSKVCLAFLEKKNSRALFSTACSQVFLKQ
jgi:hypothetical protein